MYFKTMPCTTAVSHSTYVALTSYNNICLNDQANINNDNLDNIFIYFANVLLNKQSAAAYLKYIN